MTAMAVTKSTQIWQSYFINKYGLYEIMPLLSITVSTVLFSPFFALDSGPVNVIKTFVFGSTRVVRVEVGTERLWIIFLAILLVGVSFTFMQGANGLRLRYIL